MVSLAVAVYETLCTFSCLICRKRYRRLASARSILPAWPCRLPCTKAGINGRDTSPDAESGGSRQHMAQLAHQPRHPWRSTLYLHNSAHVFFFRSSRFQGLPCCGFFSLCFLTPWRITQKAREVGRQCNTLFTGRAGLNSLWDNPPARLHTAGPSKAFE